MTETRRNSSRAPTSLRWTSTAGRAVDLQRVADRPRVVRPGAGVEDDAVGDPVEAVQVLDERALEVRLEEARLEAQLVREAADLLLQAVERQLAVDAPDRGGRAGRGSRREAPRCGCARAPGASLSGHAAGVPMRERWALVHRLRASGAALAAALIGACALIALARALDGRLLARAAPPLHDLLGGTRPRLRRAGADLRRERLAAPAVRLARRRRRRRRPRRVPRRRLACLLPLAALIFWLVRRMQDAGRPAHEQAALAAVLLAAPVALRALRDGHPEDVLAATLRRRRGAARAPLARAAGRHRARSSNT